MCKQGFSEILKHPPVVRAAHTVLVVVFVLVLILCVFGQDPLDKLLGDDDDDEFAARRPAPTVVKVGPQPRASRRRQRPVAQPDPEAEEVSEEMQQPEEMLTRTTRRQRQANRELREAVQDLRQAAQDHGVDEEEALAMALGVDEDEALAMAIAASLADDPTGNVCHIQSAAGAEPAEVELTVAANPGARTGRATRRHHPTDTNRTGTQSRRGARRPVARKRVVHVDPISGQRIRAPRFPRPSVASPSAEAPAEVAQVQEPAEDDETAGESDDEQPNAESVAAESERRAREQVLEERLGRTLAAPVAAPSPLKPFAHRRPVSIGSPLSPDVMSSSPTDQDSVDTSSVSLSSDIISSNESPTSTSALDISAGGGQDLMSRLQKRMRSGKASTTARQSATPLQEREQNCQDENNCQLADDM